MDTLTLTSPAFPEGDWIPRRFTGRGEDHSPELHINGLCSEVQSLLITLDDEGHPLIPHYNHWVAWNIPPLAVLPEGLPAGAVVEAPFHLEQGMAYGKHRYRGPKPPFRWDHVYRFTVYALDDRLTLPASADKVAALAAAEGHILQSAILTGHYQSGRRE